MLNLNPLAIFSAIRDFDSCYIRDSHKKVLLYKEQFLNYTCHSLKAAIMPYKAFIFEVSGILAAIHTTKWWQMIKRDLTWLYLAHETMALHCFECVCSASRTIYKYQSSCTKSRFPAIEVLPLVMCSLRLHIAGSGGYIQWTIKQMIVWRRWHLRGGSPLCQACS